MTEKYSPQKHEFGTDAAAEWAKSITPGQGKKEAKLKKIRDVTNPRKKKEVAEVAGTDFFAFRSLSEDVTFRAMTKRVQYASQPGRPGKRVSLPTRELIMTLTSYNSRAEAAKAKSQFNVAKPVWDVTLHAMDTKLYVRELAKKGKYIYFLSFDDVLPYLVTTGKKRIPKKDWKYFGDEYEYISFHTFGKNYVAAPGTGLAAPVGETGEETVGAVPVQLADKSSSELGRMMESSVALRNFIESLTTVDYIDEKLNELMDVVDNEELVNEIARKLNEGYDEEVLGDEFYKSLKRVIKSAKSGDIGFSVKVKNLDKIQVTGKRMNKSEELVLNIPWFKDYVYYIKQDGLAPSVELFATSNKPLTREDLMLLKTWCQVDDHPIFENLPRSGSQGLDYYIDEDLLGKSGKLRPFVSNVMDDAPTAAKKKLRKFLYGTSNANYQFKDDSNNRFKKAPKSYSMKGSPTESFKLVPTNRKTFMMATLYEHSEDGSVVIYEDAHGSAELEVNASSLSEVVKKLQSDKLFDERNWEVEGSWVGDGGYGYDELHIVRGPRGLKEETERWDDWLDKLNEAEGNLESLGYGAQEFLSYCEEGMTVMDEDGNSYEDDEDLSELPDPNYEGAEEEDPFEEKVKGYKMKGSANKQFLISNYHKKAWTTYDKYIHDNNGSVVGERVLWRWGSSFVDAPNIKEVLKKLEEDGGFDSRKWEDEEGGDKTDGQDTETFVIRGPKGLRPETDAYQNWEANLLSAQLYTIGYEHDEEYNICDEVPILIESLDEENSKIIYDPDEEINVELALVNGIRVTHDADVSNDVMEKPPEDPNGETEQNSEWPTEIEEYDDVWDAYADGLATGRGLNDEEAEETATDHFEEHFESSEIKGKIGKYTIRSVKSYGTLVGWGGTSKYIIFITSGNKLEMHNHQESYVTGLDNKDLEESDLASLEQEMIRAFII